VGEDPLIPIDRTDPWRIQPASSAEPAASLAAQELSTILARVAGRPFQLSAEPPRPGEPVIVLSHGDRASDGFEWHASGERIELRGGSARGLLHAVYDLLEELGCRWVEPGERGERLPAGTQFTLPEAPVQEAPALPGRCLVIGHYAFMKDIEDWIVWAGRNRLNGLFAHVIRGSLVVGAAPASQWERHRNRAAELARQRGMVIEYGGHGLADLLPRRSFRKMPDAFRWHSGRRRSDHNFCPSSEQARSVIRQNAQALFRAHPEVDVWHLWPDDVPEGGWCSCDRCRSLSPSDQALLAINTIATALREVNPAAQVSFLAYHDTEPVPEQVTPAANVCLLWAPRRRCYAHAADQPDCPVNTPQHAETLRRQVAHFEAAGASPARVFEYYLDAILFKSVLPPLPTVMQQDLDFYRRCGVHTLQALMTGDYPWLSPQLNAWLFARLAWDPRQPLESLMADFGRAAYGAEGANFAAYCRELEQAFALALQLAPEQIQLAQDLRRVWQEPPTDMGDPAYAAPAELERRARQNERVATLVTEAEQHLAAACASADTDRCAGERANSQLMGRWLRFDLARVRLYAALATGGSEDTQARVYLEQSERALANVLAWADSHLEDGRFRANFYLLHRMYWGLRLRAIRASHFSGRLGSWAVKLRGLLDILVALLRLRGAYR
jgi:hypothetical protein